MTDNKNKCLICDAELVYYTEPRKMTCMLCGREFDSNVECVNGHLICDVCHSRNMVGASLLAAYHDCGGDIDLEKALPEWIRSCLRSSPHKPEGREGRGPRG